MFGTNDGLYYPVQVFSTDSWRLLGTKDVKVIAVRPCKPYVIKDYTIIVKSGGCCIWTYPEQMIYKVTRGHELSERTL